MASESDRIAELTNFTRKLVKAVADAEFFHDCAITNAQTKHDKTIVDAQTEHGRFVRQANTDAERALAEAQAAHAKAIADLTDDYERVMAAAASDYNDAWTPTSAEIKAIIAVAGLVALPWDDVAWSSWSPVTEGTPAVTRLGQLVESGPWDTLTTSALVPFLGGQSLLLKSNGAGRSRTVAAEQSFVLRLLATVPAGNLRFTFIDPIDLGLNVAAFMHLADYDEVLTTSRAWTEPHHIEQRLADLTEHIENVIQKHLRNRYATIEEYNADANNIVEPFRVLVVYDFPANFTETATRRLISVLQNGHRCGVYAIIHADPTQQLPHGFQLADLECNVTVIAQQGEGFVWVDKWPNPEESFAGCRLELDAPPPPELVNRIVTAVGQAVKDMAQLNDAGE